MKGVTEPDLPQRLKIRRSEQIHQKVEYLVHGGFIVLVFSVTELK